MAVARRLRVPHEVADLIRGLHPGLKTGIRAALDVVRNDPAAGKTLRDDLAGLSSFRVGRFRIIYREASPRVVEIVALGPRVSIYRETLRLIGGRPRAPRARPTVYSASWSGPG